MTREFHEGMCNPAGKLTKLAIALGFAVVSLIFFQRRLRRRSKSESSGSPIKIYIVQAHSQAADRLERRPVLEERGIDPGLAAADEGVGGSDLLSQRLGARYN